jgi:hypothetical protein
MLWPTSIVSGVLLTFIETSCALAEQKIQQHSKLVAIPFILIRDLVEGLNLMKKNEVMQLNQQGF